MAKLVLGYWDIRGLAEPARTMLEYGGIDFDDKRYKCGQEPPYDRSVWTDVKFSLGLDFPNLPYMMDGEIKITESWAIYRHIGRKVGIMPATPQDLAHADMLEGVIKSLQQGFTGVCYNPDFESKKEGMKSSQLEKLKSFDAYLSGRKFLLGGQLSYVDFPFFETLDHHRTMFPDILDKFGNIKDYVQRFESLDKIAVYRKGDRFKKFPINNPQARWGGK